MRGRVVFSPSPSGEGFGEGFGVGPVCETPQACVISHTSPTPVPSPEGEGFFL